MFNFCISWEILSEIEKGGISMSRIILLLFSSVLFLGIIGCSMNEDDSPPPVEDEPTVETDEGTDDTTSEDDTSNDDTTSEDNTSKDEAAEEDSDADAHNYIDFELDVDYGENKEYDAEYELENGNVDAEIEDDLNNVKLEGDEAFDKLEPMLKELNIEQNTSKEDAIKDTLTVFDLPDDYIKFDLEITFEDGTKVEFEERK